MTDQKQKTNPLESLSYILFSNPVLVGGLVIGQLAAVATGLQNAVALTVTFLFVTFPVLIFASAIGKKLPKWSRVAVYMLLSAVMLYPAYLICKNLSATVLDSVGIYLPILAVSTVPAVYAARYSENHKVGKAALDGLCLSAGFGVVAAVLGLVREFFGNGTVWGVKVSETIFPAVRLPFWGFILLGFMAAGIGALRILLHRPDYVEPILDEEVGQ